MSEYATYTSIDQDLKDHSRENPNIVSYSNDINSYIKSRNSAYSLPLEIKNHKPYKTDYDDKYNKKNKIRFSDNKIEFIHDNIDIINVVILTLLALIVRLWKISYPKQVVFDEVHFGGFANKYIRESFFMDVHPPLAKIMFAFVAYIFGYRGDFSFEEIGLDYTDGVPYVAMRVYSGLCGVLVVPIAYYTIKGLKFSSYSAFLGALFVLFENSLATQSRLILLDSQLILFASLTLLSWANFIGCKETPWSFDWWYWLAATGVGLGLTFSVKWVGLFIIATIGLATIKDLWDILGNIDISIYQVIKHFFARAFCLIVIPLTLYAFFFKIHLLILSKQGSGYSFMSPEFQASFRDSKPEPTYYDVAYNSRVYIRHVNSNGGYLHSHNHVYPNGSKQQQITLYSFTDDNSEWLILPQKDNRKGMFGSFLKDGDTVRLQHIPTGRRLHSHDIRPPMSDEEYQNEVSGYGGPGVQDPHDNWVIEIYEGKTENSTQFVKTFDTTFRLRHKNTGCYLFSHNVKLPEWGFSQQEVTCAKNGLKKNTIWVIESSKNSLLGKNTELVSYKKPNFLQKFIELNTVMWNVNKGLTSSHPYESHPSSWLFLRRGISFWTGKKDYVGRIYLTGNPVSWYGGAIAVLFYIGFFCLSHFIQQIHRKSLMFDTNSIYYSKGGYLFTGYFWHYFPFFIMGRQLFIHHYLPCVYISILLFMITVETIFKRVKYANWIVPLVISILSIITFYIYSPFTYGTFMSTKHCKRMRLRSTWDWDCNYYDKNIHRLKK